MPTIRVTDFGDRIITRADTELGAVSTHEVCGGAVDHTAVSDEYQALSCRKCNLRSVFPRNIKTWDGLAHFFGDDPILVEDLRR